jgi:hypothetical protein
MNTITLPDKDYLAKLGEAAYSYGYLEWLVIEVTAKVLGKTMDETARNLRTTASPILIKASKEALERNEPYAVQLQKISKEFKAITNERNNIFHAWPATYEDGTTQILNRWRPDVMTGFITVGYLESFIEKASVLSTEFASFRTQL